MEPDAAMGDKIKKFYDDYMDINKNDTSTVDISEFFNIKGIFVNITTHNGNIMVQPFIVKENTP